jgi:hypothetical protein
MDTNELNADELKKELGWGSDEDTNLALIRKATSIQDEKD